LSFGTIFALAFLSALTASLVVMVSIYYITKLYMLNIKDAFVDAIEDSANENLIKR
jgi:hypothetical protein